MLTSRRLTSVLLCALVVYAAPTSPVVPRQIITALTAAQVAAFKPYSYYAASAYCQPSTTLAWSCGANCNANSGFQPVASGGDGSVTQFWYVGYDPALATIIVAHQGTDSSAILPLVTDADFFLDNLDSNLFPGINSSIKVHDGFGNAQARAAASVLSAVQTAMTRYGTTRVTIVGHSLGGAIALIDSVYLPLHLPAGTIFRTITYGLPRVGNQAFADYIDAQTSLTHTNNKHDAVPILPGRFLGFRHPGGEIHIESSGSWASCPGQDNTNEQCTIGYVPNIFSGVLGDHSGPYDGVNMGC